MLTFQQVILTLQQYWDRQGCALLQPYDMEVGAGTSHTATFLRAIGPEPWKAAYVQPSRRPAFTRFNVFLRDSFECQYCGDDKDLTFDHLIPRSKGGLTRWDNVVTACAPCNLLKGGRLPREAQMFPKLYPVEPTVLQLQHAGRAFPPNHLHESWRDYLYWDTPLEA